MLETLHAKKDAVYGDAWRKRGETLSIFPNIARKYDRLEIAATQGELFQAATGKLSRTVEPLLDTVADLAIYALKYLTFLAEQQRTTFPSELDASLCSDFNGALRQTRLALSSRKDGTPVGNHLDETFRRISGEMERLEQILVGSGPVVTPDVKVRAAFALAVFSLVLLDQLVSYLPAAWAAFVAEVDEL
ncbi:MAG: hypothetical protein ACRDJW_08695 [Thermomicrobiales bacterium]